MLKMNPDAHDIRMKYIKQKCAQPGKILEARTEFMRLEAGLMLKFLKEKEIESEIVQE